MSTISMNRPGTTIRLYDQSATSNVVEDTLIRPLFLQLFTSDKGPENLRTVHGNEFFKLYGNTPSFKKHGQPLLQAAEIIKAGGEVLCKRIVAEDATLANLVVVAKVSSEQTQKTDSNGKPLYIDATTGIETTDSNGGENERVMINIAKIKYDAVSIKGVQTLDQVKLYASTLLKDKLDVTFTDYDQTTKVGDPLTDKNPVGQVNDTDDEDFDKYIYPLFIVTDNGRGESSKRFNITPDYVVSKSLNFQLYKLNFIGDTEDENEYVWFNFRDDIIYLNKSMSLDMIGGELSQIKASSFTDSISQFINRVSTITGIDSDELKKIDIIFGRNRKGDSIPQIVLDDKGYTLNGSLGLVLHEGDNGAFGSVPIEAATYSTEMIKVLNGTFDDSIYDRDRFMIDACLDANYPDEVKTALYDLAVYREDFIYFRDYGLNATTFNSIENKHFENPRSKFIADYCQSWDVIDSWTKKRITVTAPFSIAPKLVSHLNNRRSSPVCGILYGFVFSDVVEGSVGFIPKVTPTIDQKTLLADMSINYAAYVNNALTLETNFTAQEDDVRTQLGWINNIFAVTKVMHNIRTECPKIRYSFITDTDLDKYQEDVNKVILRNKDDFRSIYMEYTQDEVMAANKIFEASIFVRFKNFEQEEIFNIYALS